MRVLVSLIVLCGAAAAHAQFLGQQSVAQSSYVVDKNGRLFVTGWNIYGQLGVGDKTDRTSFVEVPVPQGAGRWTMVAGGGSHAVAIADSDKLYVWGSNRYGQLGIGIPLSVVVPMRVANPEGVKNWKWVSAGEDHCVALSTDGRLYAWGNNDHGQVGTGNNIQYLFPQRIYPGDSAVSWSAVAAGPGYTVGISTYNQLYGWGVDSAGMCQNATSPTRVARKPFRGKSPLTAIAAGAGRQSTLLSDGYYAKFGSHEKLTTTKDKLIASVADGANHTLMIEPNGLLRAGGANDHGQLGQGDTLPRVGYHRPAYSVGIDYPPNVTQFVQVAAGMNHSLALGNDGWLYGWGSNEHGELGLPKSTPFVTRPIRILLIGDSIHMAATITRPRYSGAPVSATLTVTNWTSTPPLSPVATVVPFDPITIAEDSDTKPIAPAPVIRFAYGTCSWQLEGKRYWNELDTPEVQPYFVYVKAQGSAPYLLQPDILSDQLNGTPINNPLSGLVVETISGQPIANAVVGCSIVGGTVRTDREGRYKMTLKKYDSMSIFALKENYLTMSIGNLYPFPEGDTLPTLRLDPAPIIGLFENAGDLSASHGIFKVFYPDSLIGFSLSSTLIYRTTDSGTHWTAVRALNRPNTFTDISFVNPRVGIAVGTNGTVLETYDGGITWNDVAPLTPKTLRRVVFVSRDTVRVEGDQCMLHRYNGVWIKDLGYMKSFPAANTSITSDVWMTAADSGKSTATYDRGATTVPLDELSGNVQSMMFYGVYGHVVHDSMPMNYTGQANPISGIVWGHIVLSDSLTPMRGVSISRTFSIRNGNLVDYETTDEMGNFVWAGIDTFHYNYKLAYTDDSGNVKSYSWKDVSVKNGKTVKLTFADPAPVPPPPDTNKLAAQAGEPHRQLLRIQEEGRRLFAVFTAPPGRCELMLYDIMGRRVAELPAQSGPQERIPIETGTLASGVYYLRLVTSAGEQTVRFIVTK